MKSLVAFTSLLLACQTAGAPCPETPPTTPCPQPSACEADESPSVGKTPTVPIGHEPVELTIKVPDVTLDAKPGQRVFAPYRSAFATKGSFDVRIEMRRGTLRRVGDEQSLIENDTGAVASIPNAFVVVVPEKPRAKPGDVVLLHEDARSIESRAVVVAGGTEEAPMVRALSTWSAEDPVALKPGTFVVMREWGPGSHLACAGDGGQNDVTVVRVAGDKVIGTGWADKLRIDDKASCVAVPLRPSLKVGQAVKIAVVDDFHPGTVLSVDEQAGFAEVQFQWGGSASERKVLFGEILPVP